MRFYLIAAAVADLRVLFIDFVHDVILFGHNKQRLD